ncbi:MAG: polyhydroxyalkanoate synthesis repressor PhaR [Alphaproteobacteria bacterium]|nr:polyhydroxyalkanoate synthesis repressor PhaR [Alphaproteobacteria bacterium]
MGEEKLVIPVKIKKYTNRRLYNTATSAYITLDDLAEMIKLGQEFVVHDAKSGDDITRHVLTQIILEKEGGAQSLLPIAFLRGLIKFYDNKSHDALSNYLDVTMQAFMQNQNVVKDYMNNTFKGMYKFMDVHQIRKKNQDVFAQLMTFFGLPKKETLEVELPNLVQLKEEIDALQQKLAQISAMQTHKTI